MKSCETYEAMIHLYLDDLLEPSDLGPLLDHLSQCPACRRRYETYRAMKEAMGDMEEALPDGLHGQILDYVEKNGTEHAPAAPAVFPARKRGRLLKAVAGLAACMILGVTAVRVVPMLSTNQSLRANDASAYRMQADNALDKVQAEQKAPEAQEYSQQQDSGETSGNKGSQDGAAPNLAEDLPPLQGGSAAETSEPVGIAKWLKVTGDRTRLPARYAESTVVQREIDDETHDCIEIAGWAERDWVMDLETSGFVIAPLTGQETVTEGSSIMLVFYWTQP